MSWKWIDRGEYKEKVKEGNIDILDILEHDVRNVDDEDLERIKEDRSRSLQEDKE